MKITFLGSGCWQGIPAPFGDDKISKDVQWGSKDFRFRTSLLIQTVTNKTILIEITPDVRLQSWKYKLKKPDVIIIRHWHWDHLFGLLDLEWYAQKNNLSLYGNKVTKQWLKKSMDHIDVKFTQFKSFKTFNIDNIAITPIPVNHVNETHGFIFENRETKKRFVYLSDFFSIPEDTKEYIMNANCITIDATYLASVLDDDPDHIQKNEFEPLFAEFNKSELILTNIGSYQNLTHSDFEKQFPNQTIAFDGMVREL